MLSTGLLFDIGLACVIGGILMLLTSQLRTMLGMPSRAIAILAACMTVMTWDAFFEQPELLVLVQLLVAVTALLTPMIATVLTIRGLSGEI